MVPAINLSSINKNLENAENQTCGSWVRRVNSGSASAFTEDNPGLNPTTSEKGRGISKIKYQGQIAKKKEHNTVMAFLKKRTLLG